MFKREGKFFNDVSFFCWKNRGIVKQRGKVILILVERWFVAMPSSLTHSFLFGLVVPSKCQSPVLHTQISCLNVHHTDCGKSLDCRWHDYTNSDG